MPNEIPQELLALLETQKAESWQWVEKFGIEEQGEFWTVFVPTKQETEDAGKGLATPNIAAKREKGESTSGQRTDSAQQKEGKGEVYEPTHKNDAPSSFREKPNPIWQSEEVTPGKLLTDAQVTPEEITSEEQHDEGETYEKGEVKHYEVAATN